MGETVTNLPCLQQSVSFGRFEHDSLCWERWSTFPSNKYLEEVEKCSTPGSVAQKKAYFEAHYKKIATRRAELLADQERGADEQAKQEDSVDVSLVYDTSEDELVNKKADVVNSVDTTDRSNDEMGSIDGEVIVEHVSMVDKSVFNRENDVGRVDDDASVFSEENDLFELDLPGYLSDHIDFAPTVNNVNEARNLSSDECEDVGVLKDDGNVVVHEGSEQVTVEVTRNAGEVNGSSDVDEVVNKEIIEVTFEPYDESDLINETDTRPHDESFSEDLRLGLLIPESVQPKEPVPEMGNVPSVRDEPPQEMVKRTIDGEKSKKLIALASPKKLQKATPAKKTTSGNNLKNVPALPIRRKTSALTPKSPMLSTPKSSKPELTKLTKSANSGILDKKGNGFTPCSSEKTVGSQSKRVVPTSMHTSLGSGPTNSDQAPLTKKSLIMESMGDKEIVKRAFKAFRTTPQLSPSSATKSSIGKSPAANQSTLRNAAPKGSRVNTVSKKNEEGIGRAAKTASNRTVQQVTKAPLSSRLKANCGAAQRNVKSVTASFGPRVQLQRNNQKDASKKLESKPKSDEAQMHLKLKVEKDSQVGIRSQNVNSKPKRSPSSIHGYGGSVRKENVSSKIQASV